MVKQRVRDVLKAKGFSKLQRMMAEGVGEEALKAERLNALYRICNDIDFSPKKIGCKCAIMGHLCRWVIQTVQDARIRRALLFHTGFLAKAEAINDSPCCGARVAPIKD